MSARERISAVSERWFLVEPLLFAVWTTHRLVIEPRIHTIRVRHGQIEYNPAFIEALDRRQLEAVLRFEAMRILLKHPYSRRKEQAVLAYMASNLTLQEYLHTSLPFPYAHELFSTHEFDQQYFEFYYYKLREFFNGVPGVGHNGGVAGSAVAGAPADLAAYASADSSGQENTQDWDNDDLLGDRLNDAVRTAHETNRWGSIAGRLREHIVANLQPPLDYRAVLRQFRAAILSVNRVLTRMKPNRRYGFQYMGSRRDFTTRLLFAVDVSGSISHPDLVRGFSTINQFFKYGISTVDVIQFDTAIKGPAVTLKRARHEVTVRGRGGTSFAPVLAYLDTHRDYDGLIIFTDGYAPVPPPPENRHTRVLWLFNNETSYRQMAPALRPLGRAAFLKEAGRSTR